MGRTFSKLTRSIKNINVENRAHKALERQAEKPIPAPRYPSVVERMEEFSHEHPEYLAAQKVKYDQLVANMRKLQLNSIGPPPEIKGKTFALPQSREKMEDTEYGFLEPETIPDGKTTLRQALKFITEHQAAPKDYTEADIAYDYKLDEARVQQVLKYFQTFQMHLPEALLAKHPKLIDSLDKETPQNSGVKRTMIKGSTDVEGSKT